jgi:two-component system nitrogen regulation response regulator GlnG/two-component system response regulator HydG
VGHIVRKLAEGTPALRDRFFEPTTSEPRLDPDLVERLLRHTFTHHLRELERLLFLAVSTSRGAFVELTREVEAELRTQGATTSASTDEPDEERVRAALGDAGGNVTRAARALGLKNRFALYRLMKRFGIEDDEGDPGTAAG